MPLTPQETALAEAGKAALENWLTTSDTVDPLHNLAIIEVLRAMTLGDFLEIQKDGVQRTTERIKRINNLTVEINKYKPKGTDVNEKNPNLAGNGTDQASTDEANDFLDRLHAEGAGLNFPPGYKDDRSLRYVVGQKRDIPQSAYVDWAAELKVITDNLSSTSQQDQINLQTVLGQYNKTFEVATTLVKKNTDLKEGVTRNLRT
ncbi:MAG: hypothetical protein JWQ23_1480 [Herminiimonas sp.]|jgi:hypothetical protein|nr:hypothetical protein [Herminiimonas sp.]